MTTPWLWSAMMGVYEVIDHVGTALTRRGQIQVNRPILAEDVDDKTQLSFEWERLIKEPVRCSSTANLTITATLTTLDGVTLVHGDRVAIPFQSTTSQNGIYTWSTYTQLLTRAEDCDADCTLEPGTRWFVLEGTKMANKWVLINTTVDVTPGTDSLPMRTQFDHTGPTTAGVQWKESWGVATTTDSTAWVTVASIDCAAVTAEAMLEAEVVCTDYNSTGGTKHHKLCGGFSQAGSDHANNTKGIGTMTINTDVKFIEAGDVVSLQVVGPAVATHHWVAHLQLMHQL